MPRRLDLLLPWPPTVNSYWGTRVVKPKGGAKPFVSHYVAEAGTSFLERCEEIAGVKDMPIAERQAMLGVAHGSLTRVHVMCFPPDRRARDLDNLSKGLLDALTKLGVLRDDFDIWDLRLTREVMSRPPGGVVVRVWPYAFRTWDEAAE